HRDARVLESGEVHDALDVVASHGVLERGTVEDGPLHEGRTGREEAGPPGRQVVDDDGVDPLLRERPHDVRADVSRASGDQPAHVPASRTREFRTLTPMVSGRRARATDAAGRPWSDGAGRQVLGVPVAVPDLGATVAV